MKATGITRRLDSLGRICIPRELRTTLHLDVNDPVEFYQDGDRIVLKKYDAVGGMEQLLSNTEKHIRQDDRLPKETVDALLAKVAEMKAIVRDGKK